jgi:hypothetical protein
MAFACGELKTAPNGMDGNASSSASGSGGSSGASGGATAGTSGAGSGGGMAGSGGSAGMAGSGGSAGMTGSGGSAGMISSGGSGGSAGGSGGSGGSLASGGSGGSGSDGCGANHHSCYVAASDSYECVHYQDVATCGTRCEPCPAPARGGEATCSINGECSVLCDSGFLACTSDSSCAPLRWDFEDETIQGFELETDASGAVTGPIASLPPPSSYEGSRALRIPFTTSGSNREISVLALLCNAGYVDFGNRTLSMAVRFEETSSTGTGTYQASMSLGTSAGGGTGPAQTYEPNTWHVLTHETGSAGVETYGVGLYAAITRDATGYLWIDDIVIN